jgi:hypothetical protein
MNRMNPIRLALACTLAATLALAGCGREEPAATEITPAARSLLAHVPADTPYLGGNLAPLPGEIVDAQFQRFAPVTAEAQNVLNDIKADLAGRTADSEAADRLALAVLSELDGKLNRAGLESLGFDFTANHVVYGMGAFPVVRMGLADAATLSATIERVLANAGITADPQSFRDTAYWRVALDEDDEVPVALYAAVLPTHLALAVFPQAAEADFLPAFLGLDLPAASDAAERLAAINADHGFTPYGTFAIDLHRLANEFIDMESVTVRALGAAGATELAGMDDACAAEIHRIIDRLPGVTAGLSELETDVAAYRVVLDMPQSLSTRLRALTAGIPGLGHAADRIADFTFGIKVGAARDFLREEAQGVIDQPFQCERLAELNTQAANLLSRLDQPLPPFVNNFRGFRISLKTLDLEPDTMIPREVRGHAAVIVENPQMFVGMAKMFLPDLSEVELTPNGDPVRVPEYLGSFQQTVAYAAMSKDAIGVSLGEGEQDGLADYLDAPAGPEGLLLAVDYDMATWYRFQQRDLAGAIDQGGGANPFLKLAQVAGETAEAVSDRNRVEVKITPAGLVIDSRYTYN